MYLYEPLFWCALFKVFPALTWESRGPVSKRVEENGGCKTVVEFTKMHSSRESLWLVRTEKVYYALADPHRLLPEGTPRRLQRQWRYVCKCMVVLCKRAAGARLLGCLNTAGSLCCTAWRLWLCFSCFYAVIPPPPPPLSLSPSLPPSSPLGSNQGVWHWRALCPCPLFSCLSKESHRKSGKGTEWFSGNFGKTIKTIFTLFLFTTFPSSTLLRRYMIVMEKNLHICYSPFSFGMQRMATERTELTEFMQNPILTKEQKMSKFLFINTAETCFLYCHTCCMWLLLHTCTCISAILLLYYCG